MAVLAATSTRARSGLRALCAASALGGLAQALAGTGGALLARQISGSTAVAGLPQTALVAGSAAAALALSALTRRHGRAVALATGAVLAVAGCIVVAAAAVAASLPLVLAGSLLLGSGNTAVMLGRYAAADLAPDSSRARAMATVLAATTVGAVAGPNLLVPATGLAAALGLPPLAGPYLLGAVGFTAAAGSGHGRPRPGADDRAGRAQPGQPGDGRGDDHGAGATAPRRRQLRRDRAGGQPAHRRHVRPVAGQRVAHRPDRGHGGGQRRRCGVAGRDRAGRPAVRLAAGAGRRHDAARGRLEPRADRRKRPADRRRAGGRAAEVGGLGRAGHGSRSRRRRRGVRPGDGRRRLLAARRRRRAGGGLRSARRPATPFRANPFRAAAARRRGRRTGRGRRPPRPVRC